MKNPIQCFLMALIFAVVISSTASAQAPVLFFSDLDSGPTTGNSDSTFSVNGGVYVNIYGNFLGATQGTSTITLNGAACLQIINWSTSWLWYQRITVQLKSGCATGNIVINTTAGISNGLPFTVRSGSIFYISATGNNANAGTFAAPWATFPKAAQTVGLTSGNTVYVENGVVDTVDDGQGWGAAMVLRQEWCHGTQSAPNAIVGYPGATATLGAITGGAGEAWGSTDSTASGGACPGGWTFAELTMRGPTVASPRGPSNFWRIVGNDMSTGPGSGGAAGSFEPLQAANMKLYGNNMHQLNTTSTNRLSQGLYLSTDSNHDDVGWNEISFTGGRAAVQIHSSPLCIPSCGSSDTTGKSMFDLQIHDNKIHDCREECLLPDTLDPSQGAILIYNNVIYNPAQDGTDFAAYYRAWSGDANVNSNGSGTVQFYNNTLYATAGSGMWRSNFELHTNQIFVDNVRNNILYGTGQGYWSPGLSSSAAQGGQCTDGMTPAQCPNFSGSNNLVFNNGAPTFVAIIGTGVNSNPLFVTLGSDFHLQFGSPAIGTGTTTGGPVPVYDIDGRVRSSPPSIGAYEFSASSGISVAGFSPTSITFPTSILVGTPSSAVVVTLTNTGTATMNISAIGFTGANSVDYSQTNNCGASLGVNANCAINVKFTPTAGGVRTTNLSVTSNTSTSPDTIPLTGMGLVGIISGNGKISGSATIKIAP